MRLIGSLKSQQEAFVFQKFCKSKKIDVLLDKPQTTGPSIIQVWVVNEDDTEKASEFLEKFRDNPESPEFYILEEELSVNDNSLDEQDEKNIPVQNARLPFLTWFWIALSVVIYFVQIGQMQELVKNQGSMSLQAVLTPIEQSLFYDVPTGLETVGEFLIKHNIKKESDLKNLSPSEMQEWEKLRDISYFHGFLPLLEDSDYKNAYIEKKMPIFEKIKQGQLYRTFTPVLLHGSILHILFNMLWLFVLMKPIEFKIGVLRTVLLACIIAVISNTVQYLISGPFFVGASGIIVGFATFTWARIKKTPWEGYLLSKTVMFFLMIYVLSLVAVGLGVFIFNLSSHKDITFGIANSAHVSGGIAGYILGHFKLFRRK